MKGLTLACGRSTAIFGCSPVGRRFLDFSNSDLGVCGVSNSRRARSFLCGGESRSKLSEPGT